MRKWHDLLFWRQDSDDRCAGLMAESLRGQRGISSVRLDFDVGELTIRYDPALISGRKIVALAQTLGVGVGERIETCRLDLKGTSCRDCSLQVLEDRLAEEPGVAHVSVNHATDSIAVEYDTRNISLEAVREHVTQFQPAVIDRDERDERRERLQRFGFTAGCLLLLLAGLAIDELTGDHPLAVGAYFIAYLLGGAFSLPSAWAALRRASFSVDFLMLIAAIGAAATDHWAEGAFLLFLFSLSNTLEIYAVGRTRHAIRALMDLRPSRASVLRNGTEITLPVEALSLGDQVMVRPGDRLPVDGTVSIGQSTIDQAPITGESIPVRKQPGDAVFAGTINQEGLLQIEVTKPPQEMMLVKIIHLVEQAQSERAPTQRLIDTFGHYYTMAVVVASIAAIGIPILLLGEPFGPAFLRAMTLLVVASPCALVISIPAAILSAISNGARHGVLFKGGAYLEIMGGIRTIALDKTGTLTSGRPQVTDLACAASIGEEELLELAASVEHASEHPLAKAVVSAARARAIELEKISGFRAHFGRGAEAQVGKRPIWVGSETLLNELGHEISAELRATAKAFEAAGKTAIFVSDGQALGVIALADTLRPHVKEVVDELKRLGISETIMISGDNQQVAEAIGLQAGIDRCYGELLPEQKVEIVRELRQSHSHVAMVGDGVNDAPALATANVGVAMGGSGTDVALETADVVLMSDDLGKLTDAVRLSRRAGRVMRQNLIFASLVIATLITSTFLLNLPLPLGVVGHEGSTLLVVLNGLRLLR